MLDSTPNPVDLDAAQAAREVAEKEAQKRREHEIADFKWVMADPRGRAFVWRLMREGGVFHDFVSNEGAEMARFLGERRQALKLLNEVLELCPEHWLNMVKDQKRR